MYNVVIFYVTTALTNLQIVCLQLREHYLPQLNTVTKNNVYYKLNIMTTFAC